MRGWLQKRGRHIKRKWNARFFVAEGQTIRYYLGREDRRERGSFELRAGSRVMPNAKPSRSAPPFCFCLELASARLGGKADRVYLAAQTAREHQAWILFLQGAIEDAATAGASSAGGAARRGGATLPTLAMAAGGVGDDGGESEEDDDEEEGGGGGEEDGGGGGGGGGRRPPKAWRVMHIQNGLRVLRQGGGAGAAGGGAGAAGGGGGGGGGGGSGVEPVEVALWALAVLGGAAAVASAMTGVATAAPPARDGSGGGARWTWAGTAGVLLAASLLIVAALLVLRLQLRLGGGKRSAVPRLRVSTVIGAPPAAVLRRLVDAASMPRWDAAVLRARRVLSLDANSDVVHVTYKSVALWPLPFRAAPRDVCLLRYWQRNARDGSLTMRFYDTVSPACAPVEGFVRARCVAGEVKIVARTMEEARSADDARTRGVSVGGGVGVGVGVGGGGGGGGGIGGGVGGGVGGSAKLADAPALRAGRGSPSAAHEDRRLRPSPLTMTPPPGAQRRRSSPHSSTRSAAADGSAGGSGEQGGGERAAELPVVSSWVTHTMHVDPLGWGELWHWLGLRDSFLAASMMGVLGLRDELEQAQFEAVKIVGGERGGASASSARRKSKKEKEKEKAAAAAVAAAAAAVGSGAAAVSAAVGGGAAAAAAAVGGGAAATAALVQRLRDGGAGWPLSVGGWYEPTPAEHKIRVRGPNYLSDRKKVLAGDSIFAVLAVDLVQYDTPRMEHIVSHPHNLVRQLHRDCAGAPPFVFCINFMLPGPPHVSMVMYFTPREPNALSDGSAFSEL